MTDRLERREFIAGAATAALVAAAPGAMAQEMAQDMTKAPPQISTPGRPQASDKFGPSVDNIPIIDAHIHLFDATRPEIAGYTGSRAYGTASKVNNPDLYAPLARACGIVGAIIVEAPTPTDPNPWYLEVSQANDIMVAVSGRLDPYKPDFGDLLNTYHKNPLFRAIRASRFYTNDNGKVTLDPVAVANLKLLADAGLAQDTANPSMALFQANIMLADAIPKATIIMDHMPNFAITPENQADYEAAVKEMAARPNIFLKLSEVYHGTSRTDPTVLDAYGPIKDRLDSLFALFGEDRVMFGTDYPNSYGVATISEEVGLMKKYFATKTRAQAEKYFYKNAGKIYKYIKRRPDQPAPA